jgi:hypothetical protein
VVLLSRRRTEDCDDGVADELLDRAAAEGDLGLHGVVEALQQVARVLRIERSGHRRRADEIRKQDRCNLPLHAPSVRPVGSPNSVRISCVRSCAAVWPPVKLPSGAKAVAGGKAKQSLRRSDRNPSGGRVITYNKWPLYTYVSDTAAGQARGQALNLNGGYWYVLAPSGKVIHAR